MKDIITKILITDDHAMIRNGLKLMLEHQSKFKAEVHEASNGKEAIEKLSLEEFNILLLDITMPEMDGFTVLRNLKSKNILIPTLVITMHKDENVIKQAIDLGALGYILKNSGMEEITKAISTVLKRERYFSNEIAQMLFKENQEIKEKKSVIQFEDNLSKREKQILQLLVKEKSNIEIAEELCISKRTIEWHRKNLLLKLNVKSSIGLIKYAIKNGYE
ncbi:MAG: response regulator [Flavobacteriia bacterium]